MVSRRKSEKQSEIALSDDENKICGSDGKKVCGTIVLRSKCE